MKEVELTTRVDNEICQRIVRELEVLKHGKNCPFIIDYYGALYSQSIIYIFMEHMDVGALDQLLKIPGIDHIPEVFCGKIAVSAILGLQYLKVFFTFIIIVVADQKKREKGRSFFSCFLLASAFRSGSRSFTVTSSRPTSC